MLTESINAIHLTRSTRFRFTHSFIRRWFGFFDSVCESTNNTIANIDACICIMEPVHTSVGARSIHAICVYNTYKHTYTHTFGTATKSSRKQTKASASATAAAEAAILCHFSMEIHYNRLLVWSRLYCVPNMPKCWLLLVVCLIRNWLWIFLHIHQQHKPKKSPSKWSRNKTSKTSWICKVKCVTNRNRRENSFNVCAYSLG